MPRSRRSLRPTGFTLIELVVVVAISGIVAGLVTSFITRPMEGFQDATRRAHVVDLAESALRRMSRDVRAALPNSIRVSGDFRSLEILHTADGARYRKGPGTNGSGEIHTAASDWIDFSGDAQWNALGRFANLGFSYGTPLPSGSRVAIYTTGVSAYADAAAGANPGVITPSGTTITIADDVDEDQIALSSAFQFRFRSPRQRFYVVDTPVSFLCDLAAQTLTRYSDYAISSGQPTDPGASPLSAATAARVATGVTGCAFSYAPGTPARAGLLTIDLTIREGAEQARLLHQVHVDNTP